MYTYLLINLLVFIIPAVLSFDKNLRFYKNVPAFITSFFIVGSAYIVWDIIASIRGDWSFSKHHTIGFELFYLPLEEIMFFITIPYACIFIYETVMFYLPDKKFNPNRNYFMAIGIVLSLIGIYNYDQYYTVTVLLFSGFFLIFASLKFIEILSSRNYWLFLGITYIGFFVVNYFLTSIPVVSYNNESFSEIRITTIPLEDFFYSFSMLSLYLMVYKYFKSKWIKEKQP